MSTNNLFPYEKELKDFVNSIDVSNIVSPATGYQTGIHNHFYGKKHTLETRKQISKSLTGHSSWNKGITGPDSHLYGVPKSKETRIKMSNYAKTRTYSEATRKKISLGRMGIEPWNKGKKGLQVAWNKGIKT